MRLVFEKFEQSLELKRCEINVLRIENPSLFSRCALSLARGFPPNALEPAFFYADDDREVKANKILYFAGDLLFIDLNDRRIVSQAMKLLIERITQEEGALSILEQLNYKLEEVFECQFLQMSANYQFSDEWDASKFMKALGFGVDDSGDLTLFEKLQHFLRIMADLFPEWIIAFVNLSTYLTKEQYNRLREQVSGLQLCVLSYEQGAITDPLLFDNILYIDDDYLER